MGDVIELSESYRQNPIIPAAWNGGFICDYESSKKRILAQRKQIAYAVKYVEHFFELEQGCHRMLDCVITRGVCNSFPAGEEAGEFLNAGMLLRRATYQLEQSVPPSLEHAQSAGKRLYRAIKELSMQPMDHRNKDLYTEVKKIDVMCRQLRVALDPFLVVVKASTPALL